MFEDIVSIVGTSQVVMERKERMLECPGCGELMPSLLLNDLNRCDNCGCHARFFKIDKECDIF